MISFTNILRKSITKTRLEKKKKPQGLVAATKSFEHILAFSLVFNVLEPLKPLLSKLQKCNQDIYKAYKMIENIISELKDFRNNVDIKFEHKLNFTVKLGEVNTVP